MKKTKKTDPFANADVVVTDSADPMEQVGEPGTYALMDVVRGVYETVEVSADGSRRVVKMVSVGAPELPIASIDTCHSPPSWGHPLARVMGPGDGLRRPRRQIRRHAVRVESLGELQSELDVSLG